MSEVGVLERRGGRRVRRGRFRRGGRSSRRDRLVVLLVQLVIERTSLVDARLDLVAFRFEVVEDRLALVDRRSELLGGPPRLLLRELGLGGEIGVGLRQVADELEPIREVGERRRIEQHGELRRDALVRMRRVLVQALLRAVGGGLCTRRVLLDVREPLLHLLQLQPRLVVLLDQELEVLVERVEAILRGLHLALARSGGRGCGEADARRQRDQHGGREPSYGSTSGLGHRPPDSTKAVFRQPAARLPRACRGVKQPSRGSSSPLASVFGGSGVDRCSRSGRRDLNPRPQRPERCALPNCATSRARRV